MLKTLAFLKRKPGMSRADFVEQYETGHAPFGVTVMPTAKRYLRRFVRPVAANFPAPDFDVITEVWFEDEKSFADAMAYLSSPDIAKLVAEDEEKLFDRSKHTFAVVDEYETKLPATPPFGSGGVKFLAFLTRKPGMSQTEFIEQYETGHAPFASQFMPTVSRYFRRFLQPSVYGADNNNAQPDFNVVTEIWLENQKVFEDWLASVTTPDIGALIAEDEARLFDRSKFKFALVNEFETQLPGRNA